MSEWMTIGLALVVTATAVLMLRRLMAARKEGSADK